MVNRKKKKQCLMCDKPFGRLFTETGAEYAERLCCTVKCNVKYRKEMAEKDPNFVVPTFSRVNHALNAEYLEELKK